MLLMLLIACATTREERQQAREDTRQMEELTAAAELYWKALRWEDLGTCAGFLQDATYRTEWLVGPATQTDVRYRATQVLRVDLGDAEEEPRLGTVIVNVQSYAQRTQVLETSVVSQQWYFDDSAWWVEPGQERGIQH